MKAWTGTACAPLGYWWLGQDPSPNLTASAADLQTALAAPSLTVTADMYCNRGLAAKGEGDFGPKSGEDRLARGREKVLTPQALRLDGLSYGDLTYTPARERLSGQAILSVTHRSRMSNSPDTYRRLGHDEQGGLQDGLVGYRTT